MKLNTANLSKLSEKISCPNYDRRDLKTGIVHIGVGGFHRSHQAYYIQQLLESHNVEGWAICGVGLREADRKMANVMVQQDNLYTLVTQHPHGRIESEIIGSILEYLLAVDTPQLVIDKMAHPDTNIVSLTITEGGYNSDPNTGEFDFSNPDIQHELAHPSEPKTVYGYLLAALRERRAKGVAPFTVLSCDNIQHNGDIARKMVLTFANRQDPSLGQWIEREVAFPNSMVDRITPVTTAEAGKYLEETHDLQDQWCVICEPFIQWVIEDKFSNGRPPLEKVGVQFVPDVTPYEQMKIRLLNAGHSVLGIIGAIHGHPTIDICVQDPILRSFMRRFMDIEVTPTLGRIDGIDIDDYKDSLVDRFSNPNIKDAVSRICSQSSAKLPKFLIPTLLENLESGQSIKYSAFLLAAWCYYLDKGINESGRPINIIDEQKEALQKAARSTESNPTVFLNYTPVFGDLNKNERFKTEYSAAIKLIYGNSEIRKALQEWMLKLRG